MLSRLGLVIHWIGFVVGITAAIAGLASLELIERNHMGVMSPEGAAQWRVSNIDALSREDLQIAITNAEGGSDIPNLKNWLFILLLGVLV